MNDKPIDKRKKYKQNQKDKGLVRFELMLPLELKEKFETMAAEIANEYISPTDCRQRLSRAKIQLMEELLMNVNHEFFTLKDHIEQLQYQVNELLPDIDKLKVPREDTSTPIPDAIKSLTNNAELQTIVLNLNKENIRLKKEVHKSMYWSERHKELSKVYEAELAKMKQ